MQLRQHKPLVGTATTFTEVWKWRQEPDAYLPAAPHIFARSDPSLALKGAEVQPGANTAGTWSNTPGKLDPMGCNVC
jgi:hypothetical protein